MRYDYRKIKTEKVEVKGIVCEFYDMRIDEQQYQMENICMRWRAMTTAGQNQQG